MKQIKLDAVTYEMVMTLTKKSKFNKVDDYIHNLIQTKYKSK